MQIWLNGIGKKFSSRQWVFRHLDLHIDVADRLALVGSNGSGKSTLLRLIAGHGQPSEGTITYKCGHVLDSQAAIHQINFAAPYIELIEEFTLVEFLRFHYSFKQLVRIESYRDLIEVVYLTGHEHKLIKNFSSGMKQRLKLALAFYSGAELILLDEPTTNLDAKGTAWYHEQVAMINKAYPMVIASNQPHEYDFCNKILEVSKALMLK